MPAIRYRGQLVAILRQLGIKNTAATETIVYKVLEFEVIAYIVFNNFSVSKCFALA